MTSLTTGTQGGEALRVAVASGLPGVTVPDDPPVLSRDDVAEAIVHRVEGIVLNALGRGCVVADEEVVNELRTAHRSAMRTCLVAEETAVLALEALDDAGLAVRVLKGVAIAHLDHSDPSERVFGDVDLLVQRGDHRRALAALQQAGFHRKEPPIRGWWEQRFGKAAVLVASNGGELDLHLVITGGYFGELISHSQLWKRRGQTIVLAGRHAESLALEDRLLNACCHAVLGGQSGLRATRDVAQLILLSGADWTTTVERAERDGVELVIAEAVRKSWVALALDSSHAVARWADSSTSDHRQHRALEGYRAAIGHGWASEGRSVVAALGPVDRIRFVAGLVLPSRSSLHARNRTRRQHFIRLGESVRGSK